MNFAQKSTLNITGSVPKLILNLISDLSNDIEKYEISYLCILHYFHNLYLYRCHPCSEMYVKYGKDYWIACKKSDSREIYLIINQKNTNIITIDRELKLDISKLLI